MPFGTQVDALLDTLGSGTSEEVETALQSYSMRDIVGVLAQRLLDVEETGGGGSSFSGAMVSGMDETNTATPTGQFLVIAPTTVYDVGGYIQREETETSFMVPEDGLYQIDWNIALQDGGLGTRFTLWMANGGPDNNAKTTFDYATSQDEFLWASLHQNVRLHAGDSVFATLLYTGASLSVRAVMGVGEATGFFSIMKLGSYPT